MGDAIIDVLSKDRFELTPGEDQDLVEATRGEPADESLEGLSDTVCKWLIAIDGWFSSRV
jgi:hypothetical protein